MSKKERGVKTHVRLGTPLSPGWDEVWAEKVEVWAKKVEGWRWR